MYLIAKTLIKRSVSDEYTEVWGGSVRLSNIGVFHYMAGMAAAMPGLIKFPSTGKEIEANR